MNVIEYKSSGLDTCYCFVDNTHTFTSSWTKEIIKNLADYSLSNIYSKGYDILQGQDEDALLRYASKLHYKYAVVFSTGTEFINGRNFFNTVDDLTDRDFFIAGHVLDRKEAYYELHHQCYVINLSTYKELGCPNIGKQELGSPHIQKEPNRSTENLHDDYTPISVSSGSFDKQYSHKMHGWNILKEAFDKDLPVVVFNEFFRDNKKHYYPENQTEFLKQIQWAYQRFNYCAKEFIHTKHTDYIKIKDTTVDQIITTASGDWFLDCVGDKPLHVILYDYNPSSLEYWKDHVPKLDNITYEFIKVDLLTDDISVLIKNPEKKTLFNITNIFCYEGTSMFFSLEYRLKRELDLINALPSNWQFVSSDNSWAGFAQNPQSLKDLRKPTWHIGDWNE